MCDLVKTETERIDSRFLCHQRTFGRAVNSTISFCSSLFMSPSSAAYRERAYMSVYVAGWIEGRRRKQGIQTIRSVSSHLSKVSRQWASSSVSILARIFAAQPSGAFSIAASCALSISSTMRFMQAFSSAASTMFSLLSCLNIISLH